MLIGNLTELGLLWILMLFCTLMSNVAKSTNDIGCSWPQRLYRYVITVVPAPVVVPGPGPGPGPVPEPEPEPEPVEGGGSGDEVVDAARAELAAARAAAGAAEAAGKGREEVEAAGRRAAAEYRGRVARAKLDARDEVLELN